ncbi:MAG: MATE family efflux transporter [Oscillospiraceae bacterium]|nr:MATE family efflux transporter [Oscillospiraceae bacterium]
MLLFALPVFLGNIFQQLYNTFDAWCVGYYIGDDALAAVSSSGSLIFMMISFFNGVAMGAGVVIARLFGAKQYDSMQKAIHTAIVFGLITGVLLTVAGVLLTPLILKLMGTPKDVLPQSISYFRWYFAGAIFTVMYNIFVGILHAVGDSKHPLYYLIFSTFVNIGLDMLFVGAMGMSVGAAAVATTISQGISAILCCWHLMRVKAPYKIWLKKIRFHKKSFVEIVKYGIPSGVQNSVIAIANVFVQSNINAFGKFAMAGCGAYSKLEGFAFLPVTCFTQALSTFVGQNLGARRHDRVKKGVGFGIACSCIMAEVIGVLSYVLAPTLIDFFTDKQAALEFGVAHMRTICLFYCLLAFSHCIAGIMRGAGKATVPMFTMLAIWCVFRVSYITVAVRIIPELTTVSWAYPITWSLSSIVFLIYFLKADWIHNFDRMEQ